MNVFACFCYVTTPTWPLFFHLYVDGDPNVDTLAELHTDWHLFCVRFVMSELYPSHWRMGPVLLHRIYQEADCGIFARCLNLYHIRAYSKISKSQTGRTTSTALVEHCYEHHAKRTNALNIALGISTRKYFSIPDTSQDYTSQRQHHHNQSHQYSRFNTHPICLQLDHRAILAIENTTYQNRS